MANEEHLAWLNQGVEAWNQWRGANPDIQPDLIEADLTDRNLRGANLTEAKLQRAILRGTVLQDAEMQGADLIGARDLLAGQLAGANLCRAKLPEDIKFPELANVDEASRSAQTLLFSMLLACIYSWITIATTIDARLLTNSATSPLPILGSAIPIVWFYIAAPIVLFVIYVYYHLHLQGVWEGLGRLPAVFPDGQPLDRRVYLWFLSSFVRKYSVRFRDVPDDRSRLLGLQRWVSLLLIWWVVPLTLAFFWARYLAAHDWWVTSIHVFLLVVSILAGIGFRNRTALLLSRRTLHLHAARGVGWALGIIVIYPLYFFSYGVINGIPPDQYQYTTEKGDPHWRAPAVPMPDPRKETSGIFDGFLHAFRDHHPFAGAPAFQDLHPYDARRLVPRIFEYTPFKPCAEFEEVAVSAKPANWRGEKAEEITPVEVVNLTRRSLRYARAFRAFLVGADLRGADLTGANLREADLHGAKFEKGYGKAAIFEAASLEGANLKWAKLRWARLLGVNLKKADLAEAHLKEADLRSADLSDAILGVADLEGANLWGANLEGADFRGANLKQALNLTVEQLATVKTLYEAHLDPLLLEQIRQQYPQLLEKPQE
jgi:uncharacterized protein YjbI with pentapeptide repeats